MTKVGEGSFGKVFKARETSSGKFVAIKEFMLSKGYNSQKEGVLNDFLFSIGKSLHYNFSF